MQIILFICAFFSCALSAHAPVRAYQTKLDELWSRYDRLVLVPTTLADEVITALRTDIDVFKDRLKSDTHEYADAILKQVRIIELHLDTTTVVTPTEILWTYRPTGEQCVYDRSSHGWTWRMHNRTWTFDGLRSEWKDNQSSEVWRYDNHREWWVSLAHGKSEGMKWRYDVQNDVWMYANDQAAHWRSSGVPGVWRVTPHGSEAQEWIYEHDEQVWSNHERSESWQHFTDAHNGQWHDRVRNEHWKYDNYPYCSSSDTTQTLIWTNPGTPAPLGYDQSFWVMHVGELNDALGPYEQFVCNDKAPELREKRGFLFDDQTKRWYPAVHGVADTKQSGRTLLPLLPPTPFVHQHAFVTHMLSHASVVWGSQEGVRSIRSSSHTRAGSISGSGNDSAVVNGTITLNSAVGLAWGGTIAVTEDVRIHAQDDATMTIGSGLEGADVTVRPNDAAAFSHLIFDVDAEKTLTVNVYNDLFFTGNDTAGIPLYLSFRGAGRTIFRLPSGRIISYTGQVPGTSTHGVHVRVLMETSKEDFENDLSQVAYEKWSYQADGINTDLAAHTWVKFGHHSSLIFVSNDTGRTSKYAAVAFDPSSAGTGRLICDLAASPTPGDGNDAAIAVSGCAVANANPESAVADSDLRGAPSYRTYAGVRAAMRISDHVERRHHFASVSAPTTEELTAWHARGRSERSGLAFINNVTTFPHLASNLEHASSVEDTRWYQLNAVQPGYVVGGNGEVDVSHNRFLDYFAGSINQPLTAARHGLAGGVGGADRAKVKLHNPSALIVDGLGSFSLGRHSGATSAATADARVTLRGNATLQARCAASVSTGSILAKIAEKAGVSVVDATIGEAEFNGVYCPLSGAHHALARTTEGGPVVTNDTDLDGQHALELCAPVTVASVPGVHGEGARGSITVPSVRTDHTGVVVTSGQTVGERVGNEAPLFGGYPLKKGEKYDCYNASSILINAPVVSRNVRWVHADALRNLGPKQLPSITESALPALVGGERSACAGHPYSPALILYNSTLELHDSLVVAGVRIVVHEDGDQSGDDANNDSSITFFHGPRSRYADMKRGLVLQLGSTANRFADGSSAAGVVSLSDGSSAPHSLQSAFIDVYRRSGEGTSVQLEVGTSRVNGISQTSRNLHHLFLARESAINLGWSTRSGAPAYEPYGFDDVVLQERVDASDATLFTPQDTGVAQLKVTAHPLVVSAGDENNLPPRYPLTTERVGGAIFAQFGGSLTVEPNAYCVFDTIIARRLGRAGAGARVHFDKGATHFSDHGLIQPYRLDYEKDTESSGEVSLGAYSSELVVRPTPKTHDLVTVKSMRRR